MAVYCVQGKLGTGKTLFCVQRAREALAEGRRVASNVELVLPAFGLRQARTHYVRVPDKPTAWDLDALGHGNPDSYDEDRNGVLILDELGTWLNSRSFQDKGRAALIDWLIHARKHGWDVFLIVQDEQMIDKQVREALIEYSCRCMRLDKMRIPVIGSLLALAGGRWGYLPKAHIVTARVGYGANSVVAQRWWFRAREFFGCYDTRQIFRSDYPHGPYSQWHVRDVRPGALARARSALLEWWRGPGRPGLKPKLPEVAEAAQLGRDEGWRRARELALSGGP